MALPRYESVPGTFQELVDSGYELGVVYYTGIIDQYYRDRPDFFLAKALAHAKEYNYYDQDCYVSIFEGGKACFGPLRLIEIIGTEFMTDIHRRKMYKESTEVCSAMPVGVAVSRKFPGIIRPLNFIIGSFLSTGLADTWVSNMYSLLRLKGQMNAKNWVHDHKYYNGRDTASEDREARRQFVWLSGGILGFGLDFAILLFLIELFIVKVCRNRYSM